MDRARHPGSRATEATEAVGARAEDIRLVSQFLQNAFAGAVQQGSAAEENPQDSGQPAPVRAFFHANERALRFASVLRTRHGLTGAHYLELAVRQPEPDVPAQLVLYAQPWQPRFTGWGHRRRYRPYHRWNFRWYCSQPRWFETLALAYGDGYHHPRLGLRLSVVCPSVKSAHHQHLYFP